VTTPAIGSQTVFGVGEEADFGVAVAPNRYHTVSSAPIKQQKNIIESDTFLPGAYNSRLADRRVVSSRGVSGDFSTDVTNKKMGLLFKHGLGAAQTVTPTQQGGTPAYLHTYDLALSGEESLTLQTAFRANDGTLRQAFDRAGCKISKVEFSNSVDAMLKMNCSVDGRSEAKQASPGVASYVEQKPFHFGQGEIYVDGVLLASDILVKSWTVTIERGMDSDRRGIGGGGLKGVQVENDFAVVSGQLECEFVRASDWYDAFNNDTELELSIRYTGAQISGAYYDKFQLDLPAIFLNGDSPAMDGGGVVPLTIPFEARSNGTDPAISLQYTTTDTTV
jgi:hypothetical protein